jgi:hypothetical protein
MNKRSLYFAALPLGILLSVSATAQLPAAGASPGTSLAPTNPAGSEPKPKHTHQHKSSSSPTQSDPGTPHRPATPGTSDTPATHGAPGTPNAPASPGTSDAPATQGAPGTAPSR